MISHNIWGPLLGRPDPSPETIKQSRRWISINISTSKCPHRHLGTVGPIFQVIQWVAPARLRSALHPSNPAHLGGGQTCKAGLFPPATHLFMPASALPSLHKNGYSKITRSPFFLARLHLLTPVWGAETDRIGRVGPKDPHSVLCAITDLPISLRRHDLC